MEFWDTLAAKLEANRIKKQALFGLNKKPKVPETPKAPEPMKLQPSWDYYHPHMGQGTVNSDGSHAHITDKLDNDGNKIN